jgi:predicted nucleotidyltransferase
MRARKNPQCIAADTPAVFSRSHLRPAPKPRISRYEAIFPQPVKVDIAETTKIRRALKKQKLVKITINLDADSLETVKKEASSSGVLYQRLLNKLLKESLASKRATESRIDRIERELREVKKRLAT